MLTYKTWKIPVLSWMTLHKGQIDLHIQVVVDTISARLVCLHINSLWIECLFTQYQINLYLISCSNTSGISSMSYNLTLEWIKHWNKLIKTPAATHPIIHDMYVYIYTYTCKHINTCKASKWIFRSHFCLKSVVIMLTIWYLNFYCIFGFIV